MATSSSERAHATVSTLGILGGGQLGRMTALAARPLGLAVHVLDPNPNCAARPVADHVELGAFDDAAAAARLAETCDVVTLEIEKIAPAALAAVEARVPLRPAARVVEIVQDRWRQREWLSAHGYPTPPHRLVTNLEEFNAAVDAFGGPVYSKSVFGGFDGRGQMRIDVGSADPISEAELEAWRTRGGWPSVVEPALELGVELSVLVARNAAGATAVYPAARNEHVLGILMSSVIPGGFDAALETRAQGIALRIAVELDVIGLLCVEFFVTKQGELLVNELAPRPHNSYHGSIEGCATSQFEQLVRATCGWPLGSVEVVRPTAIVNLLGEVWMTRDRPPAFERALALPGVRLHLYGKGEPRSLRKMGHLSAPGSDSESALAAAREAYARL